MELRELIERVEVATEGSRELDALVVCAARGWTFIRKESFGYVYQRSSGGPVRSSGSDEAHVTASVDAALSLLELVLPGWTVANIGQDDGKLWWAELREGFQTSYSRVAISGKRPTPALAVLSATLRAIQATRSEEGER